MKRKTRILLDAGHPAKDNLGAIHDGVHEADINLQVALRLGDILAGQGFAVGYTRKTSHGVELADRVHIEHLTKPDLFLSLHCNSAESPGVTGIEVYTSIGTTNADLVADYLCASLAGFFPDTKFRLDLSDGDADKEANFYVLNNTRCPAVLVEMGFLSNDQERAWLQSQVTQNMIATALTLGLAEWRGEA